MEKIASNKKAFRSWRAREELKIVLLKTIASFKSKEEEGYKLTKKDVQRALAEMLAKSLEK